MTRDACVTAAAPRLEMFLPLLGGTGKQEGSRRSKYVARLAPSIMMTKRTTLDGMTNESLMACQKETSSIKWGTVQ
jgi:hypothetical protein